MIYPSLKKTFLKRKILITGNTGFKGSWLSLILCNMGADVYGYALEPPTEPSLFKEAGLDEISRSYTGDIRNYEYLLEVIKEVQPEIIIHMAAQSLVLESYKNTIETYSTNVMGTVNLLEALRHVDSVKVLINVTSDKCYENKEWHWGYREDDVLGGHDPYSNSKACSELVTSAFRNSFFNSIEYGKHGLSIATVRAGNVIGGGDYSPNRLIPDFIRAVEKGEKLVIRNPFAIRPWQHVIEPLTGYLILAKKLLETSNLYTGAWNFGPDDKDAKNVEWIVKEICTLWGGNSIQYEIHNAKQPHEAHYLKLDCSKSKTELGWHPQWTISKALENIVEWNKNKIAGKNIKDITTAQINSYYTNY